MTIWLYTAREQEIRSEFPSLCLFVILACAQRRWLHKDDREGNSVLGYQNPILNSH